jgi:hypothetical protein
MIFLFPGRMDLNDLPYEMRRVANLLQRHQITSAYGVRLRLQLLDSRESEITLRDSLGEELEILDVPPFRRSLTNEVPCTDLFEMQPLVLRAEMPLSLEKGGHSAVMRGETGADRGPAAFERMARL